MAKKDSSPRRLKGYYKFSKKYPSRRGTGYAIGESRKMKKRERSLKVLTAFLLIALFAVAFVGVSLYIKLSARPLPEKKPETENTVTVENMGEIRAIFLENATLGDADGFSRFLENAKKNGFNSVMLDFKDSNGVLTYGSSLIDIPAGYEYNEVNQAVLDKIKTEGFKVIARVYCFEDSISPQRLGAYVYEDTEKTKIWFDAPAVQGGGVWLDPVDERAQNYLCSVIKEISDFGADCIYLESVEFPAAYNGAVPVFTADDTTLNKNLVLMQFIEKASSAAGNRPLFMGTSYDGAVGGEQQRRVADGRADLEHAVRPQVADDREEDLAAVLVDDRDMVLGRIRLHLPQKSFKIACICHICPSYLSLPSAPPQRTCSTMARCSSYVCE